MIAIPLYMLAMFCTVIMSRLARAHVNAGVVLVLDCKSCALIVVSLARPFTYPQGKGKGLFIACTTFHSVGM